MKNVKIAACYILGFGHGFHILDVMDNEPVYRIIYPSFNEAASTCESENFTLTNDEGCFVEKYAGYEISANREGWFWKKGGYGTREEIREEIDDWNSEFCTDHTPNDTPSLGERWWRSEF